VFITAPDGTIITLTVIELRGERVRIGIDAPREWKIQREEVLEKPTPD
jgi:carbon storage regulator CsrA